jgi:hypothetical protein
VLTSALPIPRISHASWLSMSAEHFDRKVELVRSAAADRMAEVELSVRAYLTLVTEKSPALEEQLATELEVDLQFVKESPFVLAGSVSQVVEKVLERRERWGITHFMVGAGELESFAPVIEALR